MIILIIDDHVMFSDGVSMVLKDMESNIRVEQRQNFTDGFQYIVSNSDLDLVLLDLNLPDVEGLSGIKAIRQEYPTIPLVVLTGLEDRDTIDQCISLGVQGYILKSSTTEVLLHCLKLILSGGEYFPRIAFQKKNNHSTSKQPKATNSDKMSDFQLTDRELEVLQVLVSGLSNKEIARKLSISNGTVKIHVATILRKLKVNNRTAAVMKASKLNFPC